MTRFLFDENMPREALDATRAAGHDVLAIIELQPGMTDADVLSCAVAEGRVLVTFDKDFGELAYRSGLPAACGVVLLRIAVPSGVEIARLLSLRDDWQQQFSVIARDRVRMRALPGL